MISLLLVLSTAHAQAPPCSQTAYLDVLRDGEVTFQSSLAVHRWQPTLPSVNPHGLTVGLDEGDLCVVFIGAPTAPDRVVIMKENGKPYALPPGMPAFTLRGSVEALEVIELHLADREILTPLNRGSVRYVDIQYSVLETRRYTPFVAVATP